MSVTASVVSEVVRQQIEAREAAAAAAADAPPMSSVQIAQHQATIAALLKVGLNHFSPNTVNGSSKPYCADC